MSRKIIIYLALIILSSAYLQLKLVRTPHPTKKFHNVKNQCMNELPTIHNQEGDNEQDQNSDENEEVSKSDDFKEVCYDKDISYAIQLFNKDNEVLLFSIDLTTPISWMKGQNCHIAGSHKTCTRIQTTLKDQIQTIEKKLKSLIKHPFQNKKKRKHDEYALIQGSSQVVKGILQKSQDLVFETRDSGRLTRLSDVLLLGLAIIGEMDMLNLHNTTFIKATSISPNLNYLCDGAISLRFDNNSQNSFLNQISNVINNQQKYVTIFIGEHNQSLSIGDISVKNSAEGLSGIHWITLKQDKNYGKIPTLKQIWIATTDSQNHKQIKTNKKSLILTLSSSAISIPQDLINQVIANLFKKKTSKAKCSLSNQTDYLICTNLTSSEKSQLQKKQIHFVTNQNPISLKFQKLILQSSNKHETIINIRRSSDQNFIILGEPVFKNYFVVLDYTNNRIGVAQQRVKFMDKVLDVVFLIRFVLWSFIIGCCCVIMINPIDHCYRIIRRKNFKSKGVKKGERARLNQYKRLQQNPYDELQGKIQQVINSQVAEQAQGI